MVLYYNSAHNYELNSKWINMFYGTENCTPQKTCLFCHLYFFFFNPLIFFLGSDPLRVKAKRRRNWSFLALRLRPQMETPLHLAAPATRSNTLVLTS